MSAASSTISTTVCRVREHLDDVVYGGYSRGVLAAMAPIRLQGTVVRDLVWYKPHHVVFCALHQQEDYLYQEEAAAGIRVGGIPLLERADCRLAMAQTAEALAVLPALSCPGGRESIWRGEDGLVRMEDMVVRSGRYRLDFGDGDFTELIVP